MSDRTVYDIWDFSKYKKTAVKINREISLMPIPTKDECVEFMGGWDNIEEARAKGEDLYSWLFNKAQLEAHYDDTKLKEASGEV